MSESLRSYCCIITDLHNIPFEERNQSEQNEIIEKGRPTPPLPKLVKSYRNVSRKFNPKNYQRHEWLCGCQDLNKLFCWYCLLFENNIKRILWASIGYSDTKQLVMAATRHSLSQKHYKNMLNYHKFKSDEVEHEMKRDPLQKRKRHLKKKCIINQILGIPFMQRPFKEQVDLFKQGRPVPPMPLLFTYDLERDSKIGFDSNNYIKFKWMTASQKLNRLYCWYCLLFADESINAPWISIGFNKLHEFDESVIEHESSSIHKELTLKYQQFITLNQDLWENQDITVPMDEIQDEESESFTSDDDQNDKIDIKYETIIDFKQENDETSDEDSTDYDEDQDDTLDDSVQQDDKCLVHEILMDNADNMFFIQYPDEKQKEILLQGRPTPKLVGSKLGSEYFNKFAWATASLITNKYYCWYCLLMKEPFDNTKFWGEEGLEYARNIVKRTEIHAQSDIHIRCSNKYKEVCIKHGVYIQANCFSNDSPDEDVHNEGVIDPNDIITKLLRINFEDLVEYEKVEILKEGRPTPNLNELYGTYAHKKRFFRPIYYNKYLWLCGSVSLGKVFCWYCLLSKKSQKWGKFGISNLSKISENMKKHDVSTSHLTAMEKYKEYGDHFELEIKQFKEQEYLAENVLSNESRCLINELIGYPFLHRLESDQIDIIRNGRPMPHGGFIDNFVAINYFKYDWLAGSKKLKKLFCWVCLLFSEPPENLARQSRHLSLLWTQYGFDQMRKFSTAANKHQNGKSHDKFLKMFNQFKEQHQFSLFDSAQTS